MEILRKDYEAVQDRLFLHMEHGFGRRLLHLHDGMIRINGFDTGIENKKDEFNYNQHPVFDGKTTVSVEALYHGMMVGKKLGIDVGDANRVVGLHFMNEWENVKGLHDRLKRADWTHDYSDDRSVRTRGAYEISQLQDDLKQKDSITEKLLLQSAWIKYVEPNTYSIPASLIPNFKAISKDDLLFNEGQFKRLGMKEFFTLDLIGQMGIVPPRILHKINPILDGKPIPGACYLTKANVGDRYFINKFELERTLKNGDNAKQTYYINNRKTDEDNGHKVHQQWTLKRAYNFLEGRPVFDRLNNAWEKINFNKVLSNGNFATDRFDQNYGINVIGILNHYSLAEKGNQKVMERIVEGIERGNVQKVDLITNDGKLLKDHHVSLSVRTSSMKVYDENKKPMDLEVQVQKGLISKELTEKLKMVYGNKQQNSQQENKLTGEAKQGLTEGQKNTQGADQRHSHGHRHGK